MSEFEDLIKKKAVALKYDPQKNEAPVIVASGMGYMAEKITEAAMDSGIPIYEDDSLATLLSQIKLGRLFRRSFTRRLWKSISIFWATFRKRWTVRPLMMNEQSEYGGTADDETCKKGRCRFFAGWNYGAGNCCRGVRSDRTD